MREGSYSFSPIVRGLDKWSYKIKQGFMVDADEGIYGFGILQNGK